MMMEFSEHGWSFGMVAWGLIHLLSWGIALMVVYVFAKDLLQQIRQNRSPRPVDLNPLTPLRAESEPDCEDLRRTP